MIKFLLKVLKDERGFIATSTLLATAAVVGAVGAGTAGVISASKGGGSGSAAPVAPVNQPQSFAEIEAAERSKLLKSQQATTKNILTSPLGVQDPGQVQRKVLLGA